MVVFVTVEWSERAKQIAKLWRKLTNEQKAPYLAKARENRAASRVQKSQKVRYDIFRSVLHRLGFV